MQPANLGDLIRKRRTTAGISLRELARRLKITPAYLSDLELGRRFPSRAVAHRLARKLNLAADVLLQYDVKEELNQFKRVLQGSADLQRALRDVLGALRHGKVTPAALADKWTASLPK